MSVNISPDTSNVVIQSTANTVTVVDTANNVNVSTSQPITNVITVAIPGPQGAVGPVGPIANTGSFATTGSNNFKGNQIISGSGTNFILQVHGVNAEPWAFGIYNDTYSLTQPGLAGWVDNTGEANIGTEDDKPLYIYTNATYNNPTLILSSSGVTVNNKLTVTGNQVITGSLTVSGSLVISPSSSFILPLSASATPAIGSAYWSGSFLFVYNGTRYMSASFF